MSTDPEETKARLDKALAEMRLLQEKLRNLDPEQRERLAERLRDQGPQLRDLKARLEVAAGMFSNRKGSVADRLGEELASRSDMVSSLRRVRNKRDLVNDWGSGWLVPPMANGKRSALKQGRGVAKFWDDVLASSSHANTALDKLPSVIKNAPELAIPAIAAQMSVCIVDSLPNAPAGTTIPFDVSAGILKRMAIEIQILAGIDPAATDGLDSFLSEFGESLAEGGGSDHGEHLALQGLMALGWLLLALPSKIVP